MLIKETSDTSIQPATESPNPEMEEEKKDEEKKVEDDGRTEKATVPDNPPIIRLPCCPMPYTTIEVAPMSNNTEYVTETSRCLQIVARLEREIVVAVATEGVNTGKEGPLTLLQIGTCSGAVYVFDILENRELLSKGRLRTILESDKIKKYGSRILLESVGGIWDKSKNLLGFGDFDLIFNGTGFFCVGVGVSFTDDISEPITGISPNMHRYVIGTASLTSFPTPQKDIFRLNVMNECGKASAALNYQFAVTLTNVFDTQVAHFVMEEHKGRRLPTALKVSEICLQYAENVEKFYSYDWRTDSKILWTSMIGNFWAIRPLTTEMIEFASGDVIVLIPDIYRHQKEYLEANGLMDVFKERVEEETNVEIDNIVKETRGRRIARTVEQVLYEMNRNYDETIQLFGVLEEDEINALALVTYDEAGEISSKIQRLKYEHILKDLDGIEVQLRTGPESWELRSNLLQLLAYYRGLSNPDIIAKASALLKQALDAILDHVEVKYNVDTTVQMLAPCEKEAIEAIDYKAVVSNLFGTVVSNLFWKLVQEQIHERINFFRLYPNEFALSDQEY